MPADSGSSATLLIAYMVQLISNPTGIPCDVYLARVDQTIGKQTPPAVSPSLYAQILPREAACLQLRGFRDRAPSLYRTAATLDQFGPSAPQNFRAMVIADHQHDVENARWLARELRKSDPAFVSKHWRRPVYDGSR